MCGHRINDAFAEAKVEQACRRRCVNFNGTVSWLMYLKNSREGRSRQILRNRLATMIRNQRNALPGRVTADGIHINPYDGRTA